MRPRALLCAHGSGRRAAPQGVGRHLSGVRPSVLSRAAPRPRAARGRRTAAEVRIPLYAGVMYARRRRAYFFLMGGCLALFVSAWAFVRLWSIPAAVAMCVVAMVIPPVAAMVANRRGPEDRWFDEPPPPPPPAPRPRPGRAEPTGDPESDAWWDELDGKKRPR
ncbi:hypothetical protein GCM10020227_40390 [Streptomyces flavovirens]